MHARYTGCGALWARWWLSRAVQNGKHAAMHLMLVKTTLPLYTVHYTHRLDQTPAALDISRYILLHIAARLSTDTIRLCPIGAF